MIERMNAQGLFHGGIQLVQPVGQSKCAPINAQSGLYTVILRGIDHGAVVETMERIHCVKGCLNTVTDWREIEAIAKGGDNAALRTVLPSWIARRHALRQ